ncbi:alcohol dehydrogenase [Penicillium macrosclerotiorum]|uniref:alcohol dehydrogenase n=1 Tax=Penicillium macrosclerotiorum TaxID=303699 RepID=UPI002547C1A1|nr:alcohol dehydrogenase [Penicillium macrosclerotiorum]KAJ5683005.1 alcohol dehydrogenase [Penicillium macrosclerotiorum]
MSTVPNLVFGGATIVAEEGSFSTPEEVSGLLQVLEEAGIRQLDTAQSYGAGTSEALLGQAIGAFQFSVDTKHVGGWVPGSSSREEVFQRACDSLKRLGVEKINNFYLHAPDPDVPIEDTLAGVDDLYRAGKFQKFGLSNFNAEEIKEVIRIARERKYVLPSIYQGNYSAIARQIEKDILPILREHNIAFYAYSPIAGGFLTKTTQQLTSGTKGEGRWNPLSKMGQFYHMLYGKPVFFEALDEWNKISEEFGIPRAALAYRWVAFHSGLDARLGDALVIGASTTNQAKQTVAALNDGPLPEAVAKQISNFWELVKNDAVANNFDVMRST